MGFQTLLLKGEETHLGSVWKTRWVHLSPHKHAGSSLQESFLAFKETECSGSKNQSKSTTWLLIKAEKSGQMQTVYQWIILPNPRTPSPGFNKLFKDFTHFFIRKKRQIPISCVTILALLNWECYGNAEWKKRYSQHKLWCCHHCTAEHERGWLFVASGFFSIPPHLSCSHRRPSVPPHPSKKEWKREKRRAGIRSKSTAACGARYIKRILPLGSSCPSQRRVARGARPWNCTAGWISCLRKSQQQLMTL